MIRRGIVWIGIALLAALAGCNAEAERFLAVDVFVDAGERGLAAYQLDLRFPDAEIVGIEGGEPGSPFHEPPHHDPAALSTGRVVIGAFTLDDSAPKARTRVARIHLLARGGTDRFQAAEVAAAAPGGDRIPARVEILTSGEN